MQQTAPKATVRDLCELYQVSRTSLWRLTKQPGFPAPIRIGRAVRWDVDAVEAYLSNQEARA